MKTKISFLFAVGLIGLATTALHAQVAINNSAANPDASAILDLKTGNAGVNKGLLPNSVALTNVTTAAPVVSPATGLIVYSSTAPIGGSGTGYYYWNSTSWVSLGGGAISGSGSAGQVAFWNGTNSLSGNGSLNWDNANTRLGIGTGTPTEPLDVCNAGTPTTAKFGTTFPVCFVSNEPMVGFNAYWDGVLTTTYYSTGYAGMIQFNQGVQGGFQFLTAPSGTALTHATLTAAMSILNNGNIGIGTSTPSWPLQVSSSTVANTGYFVNTAATGTGLWANGSGTNSWGVYSSGTEWGVQGSASNPSSSWGIEGDNSAAAGTGTGTGVYGKTSQQNGYGIKGVNNYNVVNQGIGIYGEGSGAAGTIWGGTRGEGIYGEGNVTGIIGYSDAASGNVWPVEGANDGGLRWAALAEYFSGTDYKVMGSGTVSTQVQDKNNQWHIMNCPEAPEILFEDFGTTSLSNGKVHVDLDPIFAKNVTINNKHPLRVMITLNDACNGVYVTNRTSTGFDVVELNSGTSNASFTYEVIANRADAYDENGNLISKNTDNRFVMGEGPLKVTTTSMEKAPQHNNQVVEASQPVRSDTKGTTAEKINSINK